MEKKWLTVPDVAEYLSLAKSTIYIYVQKKILPAHKMQSGLRFSLKEIDSYMEGKKIK